MFSAECLSHNLCHFIPFDCAASGMNYGPVLNRKIKSSGYNVALLTKDPEQGGSWLEGDHLGAGPFLVRKLLAAGYVMSFTEQKPLNTNIKKCAYLQQDAQIPEESKYSPLFFFTTGLDSQLIRMLFDHMM